MTFRARLKHLGTPGGLAVSLLATLTFGVLVGGFAERPRANPPQPVDEDAEREGGLRPDPEAITSEIEPDLVDDAPPEDELLLHRAVALANTDSVSGRSLHFPAVEDAHLGENLVSFASPRYPEIREPGLQIYVFDIGQADSALFVGPPPEHRSMLIDIGEEVNRCQGNYKKVAKRVEEILGEKHLDYLVITHYHTDHMGGVGRCKKLDERTGGIFGLLDAAGFTVGTLIDRGDLAESLTGGRSKPHTELLRRIDRWITEGRVGNRLIPALGTTSIDLGSPAEVDVLAVSGYVNDSAPGAMGVVLESNPTLYTDSPASENDFSIALEVSFLDFEYFTAGDLTGASRRPYRDYEVRTFSRNKSTTYTNVESYLVEHWTNAGRETDVELYQANHHGSGHSSTADLADQLEPEVVIYSCGGRYNHPNRSVVERFKDSLQLVTTGVASKEWPAQSFSSYGEIAGEIQILVAPDGNYYSINGIHLPAQSDAEEAN